MKGVKLLNRNGPLVIEYINIELGFTDISSITSFTFMQDIKLKTEKNGPALQAISMAMRIKR